MKNRLTDLNDVLFAQLERLADEAKKGESLADEIKRAEAIVQVGDKIVDNARLQLAAVKLVAEHGDKFSKPLALIAGTNGSGTGTA